MQKEALQSLCLTLERDEETGSYTLLVKHEIIICPHVQGLILCKV